MAKGRGTKLDSQDYDPREPQHSVYHIDSLGNGSPVEYRTYKRRWFGLIQLSLMNIVVSWDVSLVSTPSPLHQL